MNAYRCFLILPGNSHFPSPLFLSFFECLFPAPVSCHLPAPAFAIPFSLGSVLQFSCLLSCPFSSVTFCPKILQFPPSAPGELRSGTSFLTLSSISAPILSFHCTYLYSQLCLILLSSLVFTSLRHRIQSFPFIPAVLKAEVPQTCKQLC